MKCQTNLFNITFLTTTGQASKLKQLVGTVNVYLLVIRTDVGRLTVGFICQVTILLNSLMKMQR